MFNKVISFTVLFNVVLGLSAMGQNPGKNSTLDSEYPDKELQLTEDLANIAKLKWIENPDTSILLAQEILEIAENTDNDTLLFKAFNILGAAHYFKQKPYKAIQYFEKALEISNNANYKNGISTSANNIGLTYDYLGNYNLAATYFYEALKTDQELENQRGVASIYLNIGNVYFHTKDFDRALEYMTNSLKIYQNLGDSLGILNAYSNIGTTYSEFNVTESALSYLNTAYAISIKLGNRDMEATNLNNIGKVYFNEGDYFKALDFYNRALEIEKSLNDPWSEANTLRNIGGVYLQINIPNEAKNHFERSLQIANEINAYDLVGELYMDISHLFETKGDLQKALNYHKLYVQIKDSLTNSESRKHIAEVEARFRSDNINQDLLNLRKENEVKSLQLKTQNYFLIISISISLFILSLLVLFYYRSKVSRREKQIQEEKNIEITKQKVLLERAIKRLKETQQIYKSLTESIQEALVIVQEKKIVYANLYLAKLLGYDTPDEIQKFSFKDVISELDLPKINENFEKRMAGDEVPENYSFHILHKSGTPRLVNMNVKLTTYKGKPAVLATLKDITEIKEYEEKLISEKERAQRATHSKSMFVAGISHEIRNHMHSIIGISEILGESNLDSEQKEFVDVIKLSGNNLLEIINEVLDLSKIESGQIDLENKKIKIGKLIDDVVSINSLKAKENGLYIRSEIHENVPKEVIGDALRITQILINFVSNAIKFTDNGGITIKLERLDQEKENEESYLVKFSVTDTGIGISKESQSKLFKPFSQTHAAQERKTNGSGLGLAICKRLAELMGGEIGIESILGQGSTFWFTAELLKVGAEPKKQVVNQPRKKVGKKILLVEDNLLNQQLTTSILRKEGYKMDIGDNGQRGFELFKNNDYSLVLMDIQMPIMDGIEATKMIRTFETNNNKPKTRIIAVTAHSKDEEEKRMHEAGIDDYLQKPFTPSELLTIVKKQSEPL